MVGLSGQTERSDGVQTFTPLHSTAVMSLDFLPLSLMWAIYSHLWGSVHKWRRRPSITTSTSALRLLQLVRLYMCWTTANTHSINEGAFQPLQTPLRSGNAVLFLKRHFVISIFRITEPAGVCVLSSFKRFFLKNFFFPFVVFWRKAMMKTGATKVGLPKPGFQERSRPGLTSPSSSTTSTAMKTSRSSNTLSSDHRLSRVGRDEHQCQSCFN